MEGILNTIKRKFRTGTTLDKLIYINVGVFIFFSILDVLSFMFQFETNAILNTLYLPSNLDILAQQPWAFITYMFLHNDFLHLLFNLIWLHFGGKLFLQSLTSQQLLHTYILGGVSGGILFVISYNYVPVFEMLAYDVSAVGASASVFAIMIAIATYTPNYSVQFPFIGPVRLKHIAIFMIAIDILSIPKGNAGGHIAHIGGAIFGYIYIRRMRGIKISDIFFPLSRKFTHLFQGKRHPKRTRNRAKSDFYFNTEKVRQQKEVDKILEKIAKSGYESLNKEEKATLFNASKK